MQHSDGAESCIICYKQPICHAGQKALHRQAIEKATLGRRMPCLPSASTGSLQRA